MKEGAYLSVDGLDSGGLDGRHSGAAGWLAGEEVEREESPTSASGARPCTENACNTRRPVDGENHKKIS